MLSLLLLHASICRELFQYQTKNTVPWYHFNVPGICKASPVEIICFSTRNSEILPCTQLHPAFFRAWTDRNCPKENLDFWLMIFPQNEKLFIQYMLSAQQILILLILYAKPYFPLRYSSCSGAVLLSSLRSYVTGRQETAALVPGFLCQSGRRRRFNVSFLSSLIFWRLMTNTIETL